MDTGHLKMFTDVLNLMNFAWVTENPPLTVTQDRAVFPAPFPEFVANLEVFLGIVVTRIVFSLRFLPQVLRPALQVRRHDIPAGAAFGQVVQGRQASSEGVRMLEGQ